MPEDAHVEGTSVCCIDRRALMKHSFNTSNVNILDELSAQKSVALDSPTHKREPVGNPHRPVFEKVSDDVLQMYMSIFIMKNLGVFSCSSEIGL